MTLRNADFHAAIEAQAEAFKTFAASAHGSIDGLTQRIEELESRASQPGRTVGENAESREHKARFLTWLKHPRDPGTKAALSEFESRATKGMNVTTGSDGAYAVPGEIARDIERLELKLSPVRSLVKVVRTGSGDFKALVSASVSGEAGWVGESDARNETNTPQLRERAPAFGELYAYPSITEWALDDIFFDSQAWLTEEVAQAFALLEGEAVIRGDGSKKMLGMLNTAPSADVDDASPLRDPATYQFVPSLSISSPAVAEVTPDALVDLVFSVNSAYRANGTFVMNSATAAKVAKLKDKDGRFLWMQSLAAGQPNLLMGYGVSIWEQIDDVGVGKYPILYGDLRRAYMIADRTSLRITVDSNITTPGKIKFFIRPRQGGCVTNCNAVKVLKTTV